MKFFSKNFFKILEMLVMHSHPVCLKKCHKQCQICSQERGTDNERDRGQISIVLGPQISALVRSHLVIQI